MPEQRALPGTETRHTTMIWVSPQGNKQPLNIHAPNARATKPSVSGTFLVAVTKYPGQRQCKERRAYFDSQFKRTVTTMGKAWWQEQEVAGYTAPLVRK